MKTIQMTIDEKLIDEVDKMAKLLGKTRSSFTRDALRKALHEIKERSLEKKQIEGYKKHPVKIGEFSNWESEQVWVD